MPATVLETMEERAVAHPAPRDGKYLAFTVLPEEFAIRVDTIEEIMGLPENTEASRPGNIPKAVNLRGRTIPVIDLRPSFGLRAFEPAGCAAIVVVHGDNPPVSAGILVDGVVEVFSLTSDDIEATRHTGNKLTRECSLGICRAHGQVKTLLDVGRVLRQHSNELEATRHQ